MSDFVLLSDSSVVSSTDHVLDLLTVSTDKADYAPGETVTITATGFAPGATIEFAIADDPTDPGDDGNADVYTPFSITDGGQGDLDGEANAQVMAYWTVPSGNDGSASGTPDALNGTVILTATGSDRQVATTTFTDAPPTGNVAKNYQHWADGDAPLSPGEAEWNGDILSDGKSGYFEGEFIPHVYVGQSSQNTPLVNGQTYSFTIGYNFYNSSGNASGFDYITTYDISRNPGLLPNASGSTPVIDSTFTDPGNGNQGVFYTVDADIISVTGPTYSSPTGTRDGQVAVTFVYTGLTSGGVNGNQIFEIYYGLHIAQPGGAGPGTNGASAYPGGSLQTTIDNTPFSGALSLQLAPSAIEQGVISGIKFNDLDGNGSQDVGEAALAGWTIYLDTNNDGDLDAGEAFVVTSSGTQVVNNDGIIDPLGTYIFNVTPDSDKSDAENDPYIVREVLQSGWTQTAPPAGFYSVLITADTPQYLNQNFGNRQLNRSLNIVKDASVPGSTANVAGELITYSYTLTNPATRRSPASRWWTTTPPRARATTSRRPSPAATPTVTASSTSARPGPTAPPRW